MVWSLKELSPFEITFTRFLVGFLVGAIFQLPFRSRIEWKSAATLSFWAALFLAGTLTFQTMGLQFTTATKSGFITTLYVIMVPLMEATYHRRRIGFQLWSLVFMALLGTALIVRLEFTDLNKGDLLTLVCMIFASLHIIWMGRVSPKTGHPFLFNSMQSFWAALFVLPLINPSQLVDKISMVGSWDTKAIFGMIALALGSTTLAFWLQVKAQAHLSPTVSSLLFLLESPFGMLFAFSLLGESLNLMEGIGAALIFVAAMIASIREARTAPPIDGK